MRELIALVEYPVIRWDGSVVSARGYDGRSGVYCAYDGRLGVPAEPTREDALAAWGALEEVVCDFPFEQPGVHKSAWLAALLTPMTRFAFYGAVPLFLFDGNMAGAGKSILCDLIALILTGRPFAANRERLLSAAITILAAYYRAGEPKRKLRKWGSFEAWSDVVRQAIVWLGLPDPMDTRDHVLADVSGSKSLVQAVVMNWEKIDPAGDGLTANEILLRVFGEDGRTTPANLHDVRDAIKQVAPNPTGRTLAQYFGNHRGARFNGRFITSFANRSGGIHRWTVRKSDNKAVVGGDDTDKPTVVGGGTGGAVPSRLATEADSPPPCKISPV